MQGWWLVSYIVLWVLLLLVVAFNIAILRQLGLLYVRLGGSLGALQTPDGPEVGSPLPVTSVHDRSGIVRSLIPPREQLKLLLFMSPTCEICDPMIPLLPGFNRSLRRHSELLVVMSDEDRTGKLEAWRPGQPAVVVDQSLPELFSLPAMPYAVVVNDHGRVASKGVVNDIVQLESVLNEAEATDPVDPALTLDIAG